MLHQLFGGDVVVGHRTAVDESTADGGSGQRVAKRKYRTAPPLFWSSHISERTTTKIVGIITIVRLALRIITQFIEQ